MTNMTQRHALKFALLGVMEQQRILRKLESSARAYHTKCVAEGKNEENVKQADIYAWHRRVKLSREARAIHLYRSFLKGVPYRRVEQSLTEHSLDPIMVFRDYFSQVFLGKDEWENFCKWVNL